ncbi:MAG: hypothetical protein KGO05_12455, partial [Chloroflexota bacterium]|nr:hypothetical protein [Chloroflexota bacterium]
SAARIASAGHLTPARSPHRPGSARAVLCLRANCSRFLKDLPLARAFREERPPEPAEAQPADTANVG